MGVGGYQPGVYKPLRALFLVDMKGKATIPTLATDDQSATEMSDD